MPGKRGGFTLVEVVIASALVVIAFAGLYGTVRQANRLASAAEDEARVECALEQRMDQLRLLEWPDLTAGAGIISKVWTARPDAVSGMTVTQETLTIAPAASAVIQTLSATWNGTSTPTTSVSAGTALSTAKAAKILATLTWKERLSGRTQTRSLLTVISRGGISKSDRP